MIKIFRYAVLKTENNILMLLKKCIKRQGVFNILFFLYGGGKMY